MWAVIVSSYQLMITTSIVLIQKNHDQLSWWLSEKNILCRVNSDPASALNFIKPLKILFCLSTTTAPSTSNCLKTANISWLTLTNRLCSQRKIDIYVRSMDQHASLYFKHPFGINTCDTYRNIQTVPAFKEPNWHRFVAQKYPKYTGNHERLRRRKCFRRIVCRIWFRYWGKCWLLEVATKPSFWPSQSMPLNGRLFVCFSYKKHLPGVNWSLAWTWKCPPMENVKL